MEEIEYWLETCTEDGLPRVMIRDARPLGPNELPEIDWPWRDGHPLYPETFRWLFNATATPDHQTMRICIESFLKADPNGG